MLSSVWRGLCAKLTWGKPDRADDPIEQETSLDDPFPEPVVLEFNDIMDLHAIPPPMVRAVVEEYLEEAHRRRIVWLRIIHGKGIGVQREMVRAILERTPFVLEFHDAPPEAGGWGATIVTLAHEQERDE